MRKVSGCLDNICTESIKTAIGATGDEQGEIANHFKPLSKTIEVVFFL